jgi:hypothetical protein
MHALARIAAQCDVAIAKDVIDEVVHFWLLKLAAFAVRSARKLARSLDRLDQKV